MKYSQTYVIFSNVNPILRLDNVVELITGQTSLSGVIEFVATLFQEEQILCIQFFLGTGWHQLQVFPPKKPLETLRVVNEFLGQK